MSPRARPLIVAGVVLGIGLGGFVDGIVFHQILQLHGMLSGWVPKTTIANVEVNMFWDGLFHTGTWLATVLGVVLLFRAGERREVPWSRALLGASGLAGWGLFNLVEGAIDHQLLGVHHVVEARGLSFYDWAFLASGVALLAVGWIGIRAADRPARHGATGVPHPSPAPAPRRP